MRIALLLIAAAAAFAQPTRIPPGQLKPPTIPAVYACTTVGAAVKCDYAKLDPSVQVTADAQGVLTIKANGSPQVTFVTGEIPIGVVDGTNAVFLLTATPIVGSVEVFRNGMLMKAGTDYTLTGTQITFGPNSLSIPEAGAILLVNYRR